MVIWITGYPGAGKTTVGTALYKMLKKERNDVVLLDGDKMRWAIGEEQDYSLEGREKMAMKYARLCHVLSSQGLIVICCTVSMFERVWQWNRRHITDYFEIYLRVSFDVLRKRDKKHLYSGFESGLVKHVVGMDLPVIEPREPHLVLDGSGTTSISTCVKEIIAACGL